MGSAQELHVQVICNKDSVEVSQQRLARLQQLDLWRKTPSAHLQDDRKDTQRFSALWGDAKRNN